MSEQNGRRGSVAGRLAADTLVMVAEDERDIADFLRAYFRASGYDLVHVDPTSPEEVVAAVRAQRPDCLLLDVRLRGFSGIDAHRLLRADPEFAFLPIVLVSADTTAPVRSSGIAEAIDGCVTKPFSVQTLEKTVAQRIDRARHLRERSGDGVDSPDRLRPRLAERVRSAEVSGSTVAFALIRLAVPSAADGAAAEPAVAAFAEAARRSLPAGAVIGRIGGMELAVVVPGSDAEDTARRLTLALEDAGGASPTHLAFTGEACGGVAAFPQHATTAEQLYMAADAALADAVEGHLGIAVAR